MGTASDPCEFQALQSSRKDSVSLDLKCIQLLLHTKASASFNRDAYFKPSALSPEPISYKGEESKDPSEPHVADKHWQLWRTWVRVISFDNKCRQGLQVRTLYDVFGGTEAWDDCRSDLPEKCLVLPCLAKPHSP